MRKQYFLDAMFMLAVGAVLGASLLYAINPDLSAQTESGPSPGYDSADSPTLDHALRGAKVSCKALYERLEQSESLYLKGIEDSSR